MKIDSGSPFAAYAGEWCSSLRLETVPERVLDVARRAILDTVAVGVAGSGTRVASIAETLTASFPTAPQGRATRWAGGTMSADAAAYCNATAAHALDMDDTCFSGIVHGSVLLVPIALAEAEAGDLSGRAMLEAFIAGSEITYALGAGVGTALYDAGWWPTAFLGAVGAAATIGKLRGCSAGEIARTMVSAGLNAGGCRAGAGTDAKPLGVGEATRRAYQAVRFAQSEARLPVDVFERREGPLRSAVGDSVRLARAKTLGDVWRLLEPGLVVKPYPLCSSAQAAVEATISLAQREQIVPERVIGISARVTPMVRETLRFDRPTDENEAMFSLPYAIACALVDHTVTPSHLSSESLARPDLVAVMDRVSIETDAVHFDIARAPEAACVTVETSGGRRHQETRFFGVGDPRAPISAEAFQRKVHRCFEGRFDHRQIGAIVDLSRRIESLDDILAFTSLLEAT